MLYCGWLNFRGVPIFVVFVEGSIHGFQYPRNGDFLNVSTNFEPLEWVSFVKSTKIGTNKNKAIHSTHVIKNLSVIHCFPELFLSAWNFPRDENHCEDRKVGIRTCTLKFYCNHHPVHVRENRQILSTEMEFSKNLYAYVFKCRVVINHTSVSS